MDISKINNLSQVCNLNDGTDLYDLDVEVSFNPLINGAVQSAAECHTIGCKTQPSMCRCSGLDGVCRV